MELTSLKKNEQNYSVTYNLTGSTPGRQGIHVHTDVVFDITPEGFKASANIDFMPVQEDFDSAKERLALYFEIFAKSLRESGDSKISLPLVIGSSLPAIGMD